MTSADQARALIDSFAAALNQRDAAALASLFTEDSDFVDFVGHWQRGRAAIEDGHIRAFAALLAAGTTTWGDVQVSETSTGMFVCHALWTIPAHAHTDGSPIPDRHGVITFLIISTADGLQIRAGQNTEQRAIPENQFPSP